MSEPNAEYVRHWWARLDWFVVAFIVAFAVGMATDEPLVLVGFLSGPSGRRFTHISTVLTHDQTPVHARIYPLGSALARRSDWAHSTTR